jgi:hypothetical protein
MKVRFLKKVRKRFRWYWNTRTMSWYVWDFKSHELEIKKYGHGVVAHMVLKVIGFQTFVNYVERIKKRKELLKARGEYEGE